MRRTAAILATLAVAVGSLVLADRLLGRVADPRFTALVGPPASTRVLARPEFRVPVRTNAAGFRGGPLPGPKRPGIYRIVVLGDSFTFGFGVRERQAWPARLAQRLNARLGGHPAVEVVNLGVPGTGPRDYLWHLTHTGLALDPDLIVVGLFANDVNDVYQLDRFGVRSPLFALAALEDGGFRRRPLWKRASEALVPNLYVVGGRVLRSFGTSVARAGSPPRLTPLAERTIDQGRTGAPLAEIAAGGTPRAPTDVAPEDVVAALGERYGRRDEVLGRYRRMPEGDRAVIDRLLLGEPLGEDVRPALLLSALVDPEAEADGILLRSPERREAWIETAEILRRIVALGSRRGARTAFVVIPASEQVDRARWSFLCDLGFHLYPAMLTDTFLPDAVRTLAIDDGATAVDLVPAFRAHAGAGLYYTLDEHWNARGQAFAAARVARALEPVIAAP